MVAGKEDIAVSAVICLGYPLKGMKGAVRDETLLQLTVPVMFVQGSKDGLCPLEKLEAVREKMKPMNKLHVIDGGDHSFKIAKKHLQINGSTHDEVEDHAVQSIAEFISTSLGESLHSEVSSTKWEFITMTGQEEDLIYRMYRLVGDRWDLIAGRLPGRNADEIERFWIMKHSQVFDEKRNQAKNS
ncbi:hypothetical protein LWI28_020298 [Acer negundo]|uniref:Myb-like domain-containing protein n=1 Tax=Acer negundo TaxID=4023 RepID=A0AAD5ISD2_ACENE|nr:hypothetical protein LWI28_020298 [Acer negundo]